jgi:FkbM family methyltransferase
MLHSINPQLRYVGLVNGTESTFLLLRDSVITPYSIATSGFQREELDLVLAWCERLGRPRGGVFLDVGANVGTTTLLAMRSGWFDRAICVEPAPENLELLRLNVETNRFGSRVQIFPVAASRAAGAAKLMMSDDNFGDHRLRSQAVSSAPRRTSLDVPVLSLDAVLESAQMSPSEVSCVWVDTQGHEGFVLAGATRLIDAGVPFCIEFWPTAYQETGCLEEVLEIVESRFDGFVDLGEGVGGEARDANEVRELADRLRGVGTHTDLFLFPRGALYGARDRAVGSAHAG